MHRDDTLDLMLSQQELTPRQESATENQAQSPSDGFQLIRILNLGWLLVPLLLLEMDAATRAAWGALMLTWQFWVIFAILTLLLAIHFRRHFKLLFRILTSK